MVFSVIARRAVVVLAVAVGVSTLVNGAVAADDRPHIMVIGDSYSARYVDETGSTARAWWSYLREDLDAKVTVAAESGAGILMRGTGCTGKRLGDYSTLARLQEVSPDIVVVAAGANDWGHCVDGKRTSHMRTPTLIKRWVDRYFGQLAVDTKAAGIPRRNVYVTSLWGQQLLTKNGKDSGRATIVGYYRAAAKANGFTWVEIPRLEHRHTLDAETGTGDVTHPNISGSRELFYRFMSVSDLDAYAVR
jgi:lysophospholipase L1-like esterase